MWKFEITNVRTGKILHSAELRPEELVREAAWGLRNYPGPDFNRHMYLA